MRLTLAALLAATVAALGAAYLVAKSPGVDDDKEAMHPVMKRKLELSKTLLEGLATEGL